MISLGDLEGLPTLGTPSRQLFLSIQPSKTVNRKMCEREDLQAATTTNFHVRPRPGRRRRSGDHRAMSLVQSLFFLILGISFLLVPVEAVGVQRSRGRRSTGRSVGTGEEILFDRRPAPQPALYRRQGGGDIFGLSSSSTSTTALTTSSKATQASTPATVEASSIIAPSSTAASSTTASDPSGTSIVAAPTDSITALPKPFDAGLGTNYTQPSCPNFLKSMINNDTFTSCVPFSLLLQNSLSFFRASRSVETMTTTLDASCNIVFPACSALMSSFAHTLPLDSACGDDFKRQNPIVRQAYNGLLAYDLLYSASCTKSRPSSSSTHNNSNDNQNNGGDYCFADAVTNTSSPTDSYTYYLPLGITLPPGSMPTCNGCLQDVMDLFAAAASNKSQPVSLDYVNAATMINLNCGPDFVNQTVTTIGGKGTSGGAPAVVLPCGMRWIGVLTVMVALVTSL